jgi:hypothetical protein
MAARVSEGILLLSSIGYISPADAEENYHQQQSIEAVECQSLKPINLLET